MLRVGIEEKKNFRDWHPGCHAEVAEIQRQRESRREMPTSLRDRVILYRYLLAWLVVRSLKLLLASFSAHFLDEFVL